MGGVYSKIAGSWARILRAAQQPFDARVHTLYETR
jgi:hypothetical protein